MDFLTISCAKMDPTWTPKGSQNLEKMKCWRAGPPMVAQWVPKASKMTSMEPPKLPKWIPELTKWSFGDAKVHKMEPETAKMKHGRTPKLQNQRKQR